MKKNILLFTIIVSFFTANILFAQSRISYNNQNLFLSGANLAWVNYASDIGTGNTDTTTIGDAMLQMHQHGGNVMRWWLHVNGTVTPVFDANNFVTGPGTKTISDIKKVLDMAWQREIGVDLCLWSFGMLNNDLSTSVLDRNTLLLTDTSYTNSYIRNCLIPMVQALKGHPAIVTWEIFNEPEGMSTEYGWTNRRVPMSAIQRFVNLCAGAIHRVDPNAKVTNGAVTMATLTDVIAKVLPGQMPSLASMSASQKYDLENWFIRKYDANLTAAQIVPILQKLAASNHNYYTDDRLIAAGGDTLGTLDFYSVHYYSQNGPAVSPITHTADHWALTKPLVVGEFAVQNTDGKIKSQLYETLYQNGYAGALAWSWTDVNFSTHADMLAGMQSLWDAHRQDVDLIGTGGDWPVISITSPKDGSTFPENSDIPIEVSVTDDSSSIASVEFFVSDTIKIGETNAAPYTFVWKPSSPGLYKITAVATNSIGHKQTSASIQVTVGTPPMTRLEAEKATLKGTGITVKADKSASGGSYVDCQTNDTTASITWTFNNLADAGNYPVIFGYKLSYASPKSQYINVNGVRSDTLEFTAASTTNWYEKTLNVNLVKGTNTIQVVMFWGWMQFDYIAVPTNIVTDVENPTTIPAEFSLVQNYPNPFNPSTVISYNLPKTALVTLKIYDILGREVSTLVNRTESAGSYKVEFNAGRLSSGVYFYRLSAVDPSQGSGQSFVQIKKMLLMK